jgi:hypothetical protein
MVRRLIGSLVLGWILALGAIAFTGISSPSATNAADGSISVWSCRTGTNGWCTSSSATMLVRVYASGESNTAGVRDEFLDWLECATFGGQTYTYGEPGGELWSGWQQFFPSVLGDSPSTSSGMLCTAHYLLWDVGPCSQFFGCTRTGRTEATSQFGGSVRIDSTPPSGTAVVLPDPSVVGQPVTFSLRDVADQLSGVASASCQAPSSATTGSRTIFCTLKDNAGNERQFGVGYRVNKAATTATITGRSATSSVSGEPVTVSFGVDVVAPGAGTPGGDVTISDGVDSCTASVSAGSCAIALTTPGSRTLVASYSGEARFNAATSAGVGHTVSKADVMVEAAALSSTEAVAGEPVAAYAVVYSILPGQGLPGGTVTYSDGVDSCVADVEAPECNLMLRTLGQRTVTATYSGDSRFKGGSATFSVQVSRAATGLSPYGADRGVIGEDLPYGATVGVLAPSTYTLPGDAVIEVSDGVDTCTGTVSVGGCYLRITTPGARTVTIKLLQGPWWSSSQFSGPVTIERASTTTSITGRSPAPSAVGQAVTVSYAVAVVAPGHGNPGGTVTVTDGVDSCSGTVAAGSCQLTLTTTGSRTLTATYEGSSRFIGSTSDGVGHRVKVATTTSQIGTLSGPTAPGAPFAVAYQVTAAGTTTPTGDVTVTFGSETCTASVAAGSCSITPSSVGTRPVTIAYAGDADHLPSSTSAGPKAVVYPFAWKGPKAPPLINSARAGAKVPLRFTLGAGFGKAIFATGFPKVQAASCSTWAVSGTNASTSPRGSSGLTYTASTKVYSYGWQTSSSWFKGKPVCRVVTVKLIDGTSWKLRYRFASK